MPTTNTAFSVTDINGEEFDLISNFIVLVKENPSNSSYADVTYVVDKYSRIKKTITSLTASQVSDEAGNLFECTIDGTTAFLNADLVIDIQDNGDGCDIVYSNYDDVSTTYTLEESRNDIETAINDLLPSGGGITNSAGNKYIPKSDGTNLIQSVIYEDTFVAINDTTQTAASEKLLVKVSSDNYGVVHSDGTRIGGTYSDAVGFWFGSYSNHDVIFFTNNTDTPLILRASTGNVDIERNLIMSNGNGTSGTIIFEGATYETTLTVADPTADRTITLPNASGTVSLQTGQTYTPSNVTTSRTFDADTVTLAELADIVGTLLTDLSGKVNN